MTIDEARELAASPIWPFVRDEFLETGVFSVRPKGDLGRIAYLPEEERNLVERWIGAIPLAGGWAKAIDGAEVRRLKGENPGVYPDILRYLPYFDGKPEKEKLLLKYRFPEVYRLCFS